MQDLEFLPEMSRVEELHEAPVSLAELRGFGRARRRDDGAAFGG